MVHIHVVVKTLILPFWIAQVLVFITILFHLHQNVFAQYLYYASQAAIR